MVDPAHAPESDHRFDAADGAQVTRYDGAAVELLQSRRNDDGSWFLQGRVAKVGILTYQGPRGPVREYVPAEELSRADSLATLARKGVTNDHPQPIGTLVNAQNAADLVVGDLDREVTFADGYVVVSMCVRRADAIEAIQQGRVQLSAGYRMTIDPTPGIDPDGNAYDAIQRNRVYNHVAIVDAGRAGRECSLRLDSAGNLSGDDEMKPLLVALLTKLNVTRLDDETAALTQGIANLGEMQTAAAVAPTPDAHAALKAEIASLTASLTAKVAELAAAQGAGADLAGGMIDQAMAMDAPPASPPPAAPVVKLDGLRVKLNGHADRRAVLVSAAAEARLDAADVAKLGNPSLTKAIVVAIDPKAPTDKAAAYYDARFDAWTEGAQARLDAADKADPWAAVSRVAAANIDKATQPGVRADAADQAKPLTGARASLEAIKQAAARP